MKLHQYAIASVMLFSGVVAAAGPQEKPKRFGQESVYDELKKAPDKYSGRANPLANDPDAVAAGGLLFEEHCEECHGKEGIGGKKAPSLRAEEVQNAAPGAIFWILSNGVVRKKCRCGQNYRSLNAGSWCATSNRWAQLPDELRSKANLSSLAETVLQRHSESSPAAGLLAPGVSRRPLRLLPDMPG